LYEKRHFPKTTKTHSALSHKQTPKQKTNHTKRKILKNWGASLSKILNEFSMYSIYSKNYLTNLQNKNHKTKTKKLCAGSVHNSVKKKEIILDF